LKQLSKNNKKIEKINLGNNEIKDIKILKENIFTTFIDINLDNNNIIKKDVEEIKDLINLNNKEAFYRKNEDFRKYYEIFEKFGESKFSIIYKGKNKENNEKRNILIVKKQKIKKHLIMNIGYIQDEDIQLYVDQFFNLINKMRILEGVNKENKNTVKFFEYFNTKDEFVIVMELWDDNLYDFLMNKKEPFNYEQIYEILSQLNNSFKIIAQNKLIHGNINLENILIKYENEEKSKFIVKLTFDIISFNDLKNFNYKYLAPEILNNKEENNEKNDFWSLGLIIYILYFKEYPYKGENKLKIIEQINKNKQNFKTTGNSDLDDLIIKLLNDDPQKRISWEDYFNHPFFLKNEY